MIDDFTSYLNSYARRSPYWHERVDHFHNDTPGLVLFSGLLADSERKLEQVNQANYTKIYKALKDECDFRNIDMPACYVDHSKQTVLGMAIQCDYSIIIDHRADKIFNDKEMRALIAHEIKHLYQGKAESKADRLKAEFDSDRAAVESTDYQTIQSYVSKSITMMIDEYISIKLLKNFVASAHRSFPNLIAEIAFIPLDNQHPSPAARMWSMKAYERALNNPSPTQDWLYP